MLIVIIVFYIHCEMYNPSMLSLTYKSKWLLLIFTYWFYYLHNSLELTLVSSVCALADYALCQMSLAD